MPTEQRTIYIVSGPIGVGKSTTSKRLAQRIERCVLLEGDRILDMFDEETGVRTPWEKRLRITWENIVAVTRNVMQHDYNVVIDFVVEDELPWIQEQLADLKVTLKYVVLIAEEDIVKQRIHTRGDTDSLDRSLQLLHQLQNEPVNEPFLYDITYKETDEIVTALIQEHRFLYTD